MSINLISNQTDKDPTGSTSVPSTSSQVPLKASPQLPDAASGKNLPSETQTDQSLPQQQPLTPDQLREQVVELNDYIQTIQRSVKFTIDEESGETVVRVVDSNTDELIRQIPSEELLQISRALREQTDSYKGIFVKSSI